MRANAGLLGIGLFSIAVLMALFVGLTTSILPWWFVLLFFSPFVLIWAGAKWPLLSIAFYLLASFGFLPLEPVKTDMVVIVTVVFVVMVHWRQIPIVLKQYQSYWMILFALLLWAFLMAIYGYFYRGNSRYFTFSELITVFYWILAIPIILYADNLKKANNILYLLIFVASVLALLSLFQSIFQMRLSFSALASAVEITEDQGGIAGLARSYTPGVVLAGFVVVLAVLKLVAEKTTYKWFWFAILTLNSMGIFVTFARAQWGVTILTILIASALAGYKYFIKVVVMGLIGGSILVMLSLAFDPDIIMGAVNRVLSVQDEISGKNKSLEWRVMENAFAVKSIIMHPFIGIGLGGEYKPRLTASILSFFGQTFYVHNGYFYITVKMGFIGLFLYLINYFYIFSRAWGVLRNISISDSAPLLAFIATYVGVLILNIVQPEFMQGPSIAVLASLGAMGMTLSYWQRQPK